MTNPGARADRRRATSGENNKLESTCAVRERISGPLQGRAFVRRLLAPLAKASVHNSGSHPAHGVWKGGTHRHTIFWIADG